MRLRNFASVVVSVSLSATAWAQSPQKAQPDIRTGIYRGQPVTFQVINGWAVVDGDIILGRADELQGTADTTKGGPRYSVSIPPAANSLWPKVGNLYQVPYTNDNKSKSADGAQTMQPAAVVPAPTSAGWAEPKPYREGEASMFVCPF